MGALKINMAEKRLLHHLSSGGKPDDDVGTQLVLKVAQTAWSDETVSPVVRAHGVTIEELAFMYGSVIDALMPEPWMNVSGPMLVPTQWLMEPHRLDNLFVEVSRDFSRTPRKEWLEGLISRATELARETKEAHDSAYGKPRVRVTDRGGAKTSGGGCASVLVVACAGTLLVLLGLL
jgi:hypothetical protein